MAEHRVNVFAGEMEEREVIARVKYNQDLDYWDGRNFTNGGTGRHLGLTKLKDGNYVLIHGTQWEGEKDFGVIATAEEVLQEIIKSDSLELLEKKKYAELKELYEAKMVEEETSQG